MEHKINKMDWVFFLLCLIVGVVAEEAFFRDQIGISYLAFIIVFYSLFFWRFRSFSFSHQRFGYLVLISVWLLAAGYYLYDTSLFYILNIIVIPALVIFHLALITSPKNIRWNQLSFLVYTIRRLGSGIQYSARLTKHLGDLIKRDRNETGLVVWKKVLIGILISCPFLFIILNLLIEADAHFERLISSLPDLLSIRIDYILRLAVILLYTFGFFGYMQGLLQKRIPVVKRNDSIKPFEMDGIITLTVLLLLDFVYMLFVAVQFKYFFSNGSLEAGFTYAEYARRGFFELLFVSLINLTVATAVIQFTKNVQGLIKKIIRLSLTGLVLLSGVILLSAFMRMTLYEDAYGFTFTRILVHTFMIFLMVIFTYTLVKIWLEKLSLFHFYFITSLIYYTGINVANIDRIVVEKNISRYDATGKIDIDYLNQLSGTGILGLIDLYEKDPDIPGLEDLLKQRKTNRAYLKSDSIQSHNLTRDQTYEKLGELDL